MSNQKLISLVIPVYEMYGEGKNFLELGLSKIERQTYKEIEVIVSDHSVGNDIEELCKTYRENIRIKYIRNEHRRGSSSANLNNAIKSAQGSLIKIMMQDEYLYDPLALEKIFSRFLNPDVNWLVTGCYAGQSPDSIQFKMVPRYDEKLVNTVNTIGSPSVVTVRNKNPELFDEDLIWAMDCEYYIRCYKRFGLPDIIDDPLVFVCWHDKQVTNKLDLETKKKEEKILLDKYLVK